MKTTTHAIQQLNQRWPQWKQDLLNKSIKQKIGWRQPNGEIHLYLGTGFDLYEGTTSANHRIKYKKRHLFAVIREDALLTVVFHTTESVKKRTTTAVTIWNDTLDPNTYDTTISIDKDTKIHIDRSDPLSIRQERFIELPKFTFKIKSLH